MTDRDEATLAAAPGRRWAVLSARRWDNWALGLSAVVLLANGPLLARLGAQATRLFASFKSLAFVPRAGGPEGQDYSPALSGGVVIAAGFLLLRTIVDRLWTWRCDLTAETLYTRDSTGVPASKSFIVLFIDSNLGTFVALGLAWAFSTHWRAPLRLFMALRPSDSPSSAFHLQFLIMWFLVMFALLFLKLPVLRAAINNPRFPRPGK